MESFQEWLSSWLRGLKTDEAVFRPYITSILEEDDEEEDKIEALDGLLQELTNTKDVASLRTEIMTRWEKSVSEASGSASASGIHNPSGGDPETANGESGAALGDQLDEILRIASESAEKSGNAGKSKVVPDKELRAAILSHLSASSDEEEDAAEPSPGPSSSGHAQAQGHSAGKKKSDASLLADFGRNVNLEKVQAEQRELRDKAKAEHAVKKERDKEDRAKQKQKAVDRKEQAKKKATKVERKR